MEGIRAEAQQQAIIRVEDPSTPSRPGGRRISAHGQPALAHERRSLKTLEIDCTTVRGLRTSNCNLQGPCKSGYSASEITTSISLVLCGKNRGNAARILQLNLIKSSSNNALFPALPWFSLVLVSISLNGAAWRESVVFRLCCVRLAHIWHLRSSFSVLR